MRRLLFVSLLLVSPPTFAVFGSENSTEYAASLTEDGLIRLSPNTFFRTGAIFFAVTNCEISTPSLHVGSNHESFPYTFQFSPPSLCKELNQLLARPLRGVSIIVKVNLDAQQVTEVRPEE